MQRYYTQLGSVNDLVDNDIRFEIFRYRILALSSMAEYGKIQKLLKHEQCTDKVEYWIAKAFLCEILQDSVFCIDYYGTQTAGRSGAEIFTTDQARVIVNPRGSIKTVIPR